MRVERSIEIASPPEKIWPFIVEPEKILKWCITFKRFEYTGEQVSGVGAPIYIEEKVNPMPLMKLNFEVTEWVENEKFAFNLTSGTGTKGYEQSWSVEAVPSSSKFTFVENFILPLGILGKLLEPVAKRGSTATVGKMLDILKNLVEI